MRIWLLTLFLTFAPQQENPELPATLEALQQNPDSYLGNCFQLTVTLDEEREIENPYFTRFHADRFVCFAVRGASKPLWENEVYFNESRQFFLAKDSRYLSSLRGAKKHERVKLTVIVRDCFRNLPWIEIIGANLTGEWTPEGSLIAVARGRKLYKENQFSLAAEELQKALVDPLPLDQKTALLQEIGATYLEARNPAKARAAYQKALTLAPNDPTLKEKLESLSAN